MKRTLCQIFAFLIVFLPATAQESRNEEAGSARGLMDRAEILSDSLPDSALYYSNQAEILLLRGDPESLLPSLFKLKGAIYEEKMVTDRSLFYYRKAYDAFIRVNDQQEIADCALILGNMYYELGDFSEAYYFYMHSLNANEQQGDRMGTARMENNLGIVAHDMGKLDEAEKHYTTAYEIYREEGTVIDQCRSLNNIGLILYDKQSYDSALSYFNDAIMLLSPPGSDSVADPYILSGVYNNTALAYSEKDEPAKALDFLLMGLDLAREIDDLYNIGSVYVNLGSIYAQMNRQDSALYYLHRALAIARDMGYRHLELEAYDELARMHAGLGSYASAYNWLLRYDTVYKDIFNEKQSEQIARLRARYEQEIKDREIAQLHNESQVQRMLNKLFIIFIAITIILVVLITVNLRSKKKTNQVLADRNEQISTALNKLSESEKELQTLNKSKDKIFTVVAHDLRNPVAAVTGFSELLYENFEQFPAETQKEYLLQIVQGTQRIQNLLENLLVWARAQMKAVKYEPDRVRLKDVVEECIRELKANLDHKKVACQVQIGDDCVVFADKTMLYTVFRNLIMNAVKFSFPGGRIWINSETADGRCTCTVSDEGIGIQPEIQEKIFDANEVVSTPGTTGESGSGLGLVICREFLEMNHGSITVESEPGNGASFIVQLPVNKPQEST